MTLQSRSVRIDPERCCGHMTCMRLCPTGAIRVRQGRAQLLAGRCIDCGMCLRVCPSGAFTPRSESFLEFNRYQHTIAIPSPALYAQFDRSIAPARVLAALQRIGFDEVVDMSSAIEAVLLELRKQLAARHRQGPLISPFCPTVVRLIQARYPTLVDLIAPVEPPQEILAAALRENRSRVLGLRRQKIGVVYVTPCTAKMGKLKQHVQFEPSQIDGTVAIGHLYGRLHAALKEPVSADASGVANGSTGPGLGWALLGGQGGSSELEDALAVGGMENVVRTLEDIEKGKLREIGYIECRACRDGCIDGCLTVDNPYEARSKLNGLIRRLGGDIDPQREQVRELARRPDLQARPVVPRSGPTLGPDVASALGKMQLVEELHARLPQNNCGACGSPTCRAFAEDVVQGRLEEDDCVFVLQERLRRTVGELESIVSRLPVRDAGDMEQSE